MVIYQINNLLNIIIFHLIYRSMCASSVHQIQSQITSLPTTLLCILAKKLTWIKFRFRRLCIMHDVILQYKVSNVKIKRVAYKIQYIFIWHTMHTYIIFMKNSLRY